MEIRGEYVKLGADIDIWQYFRTHYLQCFPALGDRSRLERQAANLWPINAAILQRLPPISGQATAPILPWE